MTAAPLTAVEARALAEEAYVYGFAMVENYKTIVAMALDDTSPMYSGFNHYRHGRELFGPDFDAVVTPNNDTLYSTTFADLRAEPVVVTVPPTGDRYFVIQLVDMGTDNFAYIGTRATGTDGGTFVLVGPTFKGSLPAAGSTGVIVSPSQLVALATRTALDGPEDLDGAVAVQEGLSVRPLSAVVGGSAPAPAGPIAVPAFSPDLYGTPRLLTYLGPLLELHTTPLFEAPLHQRLARIGVGPHLRFELDGFAPEVQAAIVDGTAAAQEAIEARADALGVVVDGWEVPPRMGDFGADYLFRAAVAWKFMYTNSPEEAVYPIANVDADGEQLTGDHDYVLRFPAGQLPPVDAFWSITLYHSDTRLLARNAIDRYSIGDRSGLRRDADGSLPLFIQRSSPGPDREPNWLPAPDGDFYLVARAYLPQPSLIDGSYHFPAVGKA